MGVEKRLVAQRFAKALDRYDHDAVVQHRVAQEMMIQLRQHLLKPPDRVAEIGCGTGYYTRLLQKKIAPAQLYLNDLCNEMHHLVEYERSHQTIQFIAGDAETWEIPSQLDLITGCSVIQWFEAPEAFFARCYEALCSGGLLALSSFGPQNFEQIRTLLNQGLNYYTQHEYVEMLHRQGFDICYANTQLHTLWFTHASDVLRHLKATGVTGTSHFVWTRGRLAEFETRYRQQFSSESKLPLTYQPIYLIARKRFCHNQLR